MRPIDADAYAVHIEKALDKFIDTLGLKAFKDSNIYLLVLMDAVLSDLRDERITPTIDAVEVVRCKDCEWFRKEYGWNCIEYTVCGLSPTNHPIRKEEDFCSRAERRTDE